MDPERARACGVAGSPTRGASLCWLVLTSLAMLACGPAEGGEADAALDGAFDGASDEDGGPPGDAPSDGGALLDGAAPPGCGDGEPGEGEECDDGEANSDVDPGACRTNCRLPSCGDGVTDEGEQCDRGSANGSAPGACRPDCRLPWCGDGVVDPGEPCDQGAANGEAPGACRSWCALPACGDGVVDPGELCDEGFANSNRIPGACRTTCTLPTCGDGTLDPGEQCDQGAAASDVRPDACRTTCVSARCGDGVIDTGEECDEGALNSDTAAGTCRTNCRVPFCGDGVWNKETEQCDQGAANSFAPNACRPGCVRPRCGDGIVDSREECDDGNTNDQDGCDSLCRAWTCPPTRPLTCHPHTTTVPGTTQSICQVLASSASIAAYRAHPGIQTLSITVNSASTDACIEHYLPTCSSALCPCIRLAREYPIEVCELLDRPLMLNICRNEIQRGCVDTATSSCPTATLALCADDGFRSQTNGARYLRSCAPFVGAQCDAIARTECPTLDLTTCGAWARDRSSYPTECAWWAAEGCPGILATCPTRSLERCATLAAVVPTLHPVCAERLTTACVGWEDRYCSGDLIGRPRLDADNCLTSYDVLRSDRRAECHPWLEATCERLVTERVQAHLAQPSTSLCRTHVVEEAEGYVYSVSEGVTEPTRFDCSVSERLMVRPDMLSFTPTSTEAFAGDLELLAERRRLGGSSVRSCVEYVDQRYWSYRAFKAYTRFFSHDARRVLQAAYAFGPGTEDYAIGTRGMFPSDLGFGHYPGHQPFLWDPGVSYGLTPRVGRWRPKNDFVELLLPENAGALEAFRNVGRERNPLDRSRRQSLNRRITTNMEAVQSYWELGSGFSSRDGWHWHPDMSDSLGRQGVTDEELAVLHVRRDRFQQLLALRRSRAAALARARNESQRAEAAFWLDAADDEIESLLLDADQRHCFVDRRDASGRPIPAPCDWSPRDFTEDVDAVFERRREESLAYCQRFAPADFSTLASGYSYLLPGMPEPVWRTEGADHTRTSADFDTYLQRRERTLHLLGQALGAVDETRRPLWGQSWSDGAEMGDRDYFAAGWEAGFSWALDVPPEAAGYCGIDARAGGSMSAYTYLFGNRRDLIAASLDAGARDQRFATHFEVLGVDIWDENLQTAAGSAGAGFDLGGYDFNVVFLNTREQVERSAGPLRVPVFTLAGFDIVIEVGASGRLGLDVRGDLRLWVNDADGCGPGLDLGLTGDVRPFLEFNGYAQLGIDLWLVEVGIGGELRLLDVSAPLNASIRGRTAGPLQALGRAGISIDVGSRVEIGALSGRLYVYLKTFWDTYRKTIFRWDGYQWTIPVFGKSYTYELQPLVDFCGTGERCR